MRIYREESLKDFEFWGGALPVVRRLTDDELDTVEQYMEDCGEPWDETQVNDFFWFDTETLCDWLEITEDELWERDE